MGMFGDLCTHMKVLKIEAALLGILYTVCGTAATPTTGKYLARSTVPEGNSQGGWGREETSSQPKKFPLRKLLGAFWLQPPDIPHCPPPQHPSW